MESLSSFALQCTKITKFNLVIVLFSTSLKVYSWIHFQTWHSFVVTGVLLESCSIWHLFSLSCSWLLVEQSTIVFGCLQAQIQENGSLLQFRYRPTDLSQQDHSTGTNLKTCWREGSILTEEIHSPSCFCRWSVSGQKHPQISREGCLLEKYLKSSPLFLYLVSKWCGTDFIGTPGNWGTDTLGSNCQCKPVNKTLVNEKSPLHWSRVRKSLSFSLDLTEWGWTGVGLFVCF